MKDKDPDGDLGAGRKCPAQASFCGMTAEERAVIRDYLQNPGPHVLKGRRRRTFVRAAVKFIQTLALATGIVTGYLDGDDGDEVGCTVARPPVRSSHRVRSADSGRRSGSKRRKRAQGWGGDQEEGGSRCRPECLARAGRCAFRMGNGSCRVSRERCRFLEWQKTEDRRQNGEGRVGCGADELLRAVLRVERKVEAVQEAVLGRGEGAAPVTESEAKRVFVLMKRLGGEPKQWKAPLGAVFRLVVLEAQSQAKTARLCGCVPALISRRVKTIESRFGMSIEWLRSFASVILEMEASVKGDRVRKRRGGAPSDEAGEYDDGPEGRDLVEDASGYLPEEKQEYEA